MKGILKIYHPEETLKYNIKNTYCKPVYSNQQHFLEVEIITDDGVDHVDDDSLQNHFPQLAFKIFDFPIASDDLENKTIWVRDTEDEAFTEADLYCDEDAFLYDNELVFDKNNEGELQVVWKGNINDFYSNSNTPIPFRLKCEFTQDEIVIDEE